jgi:hypothetical protein
MPTYNSFTSLHPIEEHCADHQIQNTKKNFYEILWDIVEFGHANWQRACATFERFSRIQRQFGQEERETEEIDGNGSQGSEACTMSTNWMKRYSEGQQPINGQKNGEEGANTEIIVGMYGRDEEQNVHMGHVDWYWLEILES